MVCRVTPTACANSSCDSLFFFRSSGIFVFKSPSPYQLLAKRALHYYHSTLCNKCQVYFANFFVRHDVTLRARLFIYCKCIIHTPGVFAVLFLVLPNFPKKINAEIRAITLMPIIPAGVGPINGLFTATEIICISAATLIAPWIIAVYMQLFVFIIAYDIQIPTHTQNTIIRTIPVTGAPQ